MKYRWNLRSSAWRWGPSPQERCLGQFFRSCGVRQKRSSKTDILNSNVFTKHSQRAFHYCVYYVETTKAARRRWHLPSRSSQYVEKNRSTYAKGQMNDVDKKSPRGLEVGEFFKIREVGEPNAGKRLLGDGVELGLQGQVGWDKQRAGLHSTWRMPLYTPTFTPYFA